MILKVSFKEFEQIITVQFKPFERTALDKKFKSLGFQLAETTNPFGVSVEQPMKFWRDKENKFSEKFAYTLGKSCTHEIINDINSPLIIPFGFNIALFRIAELQTSFPAFTLISAPEIKDCAIRIKKAMILLFEYENEVIVETTMKIKTTQTEEII